LGGLAECVSLSWMHVPMRGEVHATTPDGRFVAFISPDPNMVPNAPSPPGGVFLRDRQAVAEVHAFCFGDGSNAACPCSNFVPAGTQAGCANSTGQGAALTATGTASISADSVEDDLDRVEALVAKLRARVRAGKKQRATEADDQTPLN
jgi:hypothetical protein